MTFFCVFGNGLNSPRLSHCRILEGNEVKYQKTGISDCLVATTVIAVFGMLHLVYGTNSPLIFASLVRYSLLHFRLSHMAVHRLHHCHFHHFHLLLLVQSFILNLRLDPSANPFLHRPFPLLLDWFHGLSDYLLSLFCSTAGFFCTVSKLSQLNSTQLNFIMTHLQLNSWTAGLLNTAQ